MATDKLLWAKELASRAGEMMRAETERTAELKSDHTVVTAIDRAINDLVIAEVSKAFPEHGVLGEEASSDSNRDWLWVCDPIDGTLGYITHVPVSMFSLALVHQGEPQLAVTLNPWTNQLYWAVKGAGAFCNGRRLRVSSRGPNKPVFIGATGSTTSHRGLINSPEGLELMDQRGWMTVNFFGSVQKGSMVASGAIDGYVYGYTGAHDIAAVSLLVTEAGGRVTDLHGAPQLYNGPIKGAIVTNGVIHDELITIVAQLLRAR